MSSRSDDAADRPLSTQPSGTLVVASQLVSIFFLWRLWRGDFEFNLAMWIAVGLAVVGMLMNLAVILINRGMPAGVTPEEIPEDERPHYHPISQSTHLAILSDWIPVGNLLRRAAETNLPTELT